MQKIGELLLLRRKELGLTLKVLSEKTGISAISLGKYERQEVLPAVENLYKIANALDLNYDEVIDIFLKEKQNKKRERAYGN